MNQQAARLLDQARTFIGYRESPAGSNRTVFAGTAGHANGQPWCATFVVAMTRHVGLKLPSESAYTPTMFQGFVGAGLGRRGPEGMQPGDIAFWDFPDSTRRIQHVGIVESYGPDLRYVTCIEGNTSSGIYGSQDNGGGVYRRTRPVKDLVGYGRPAYQEDEKPIMPTNEFPAYAPVVAFQMTPSGQGYYIVTADGGVYGFGDAQFFGRLIITNWASA